MNSKKVNWLFLVILLVNIAIGYLFAYIRQFYEINTIVSLLLSGMILVVPALIFLFTSKVDRKEILPFKKIKIASIFMIILFTYLIIPLTTLINALSLFFTDNVVEQASEQFMDLPFLLLFFLIAIYAPLCEEITFRGIFYHSYKKSGSAFSALLLSAIAFGFVHSNFNQMSYAIVIGIILVLLKEATGSMWGPILFHVVFNGNSVILMYITDVLEIQSQANSSLIFTKEMMIGVSFIAVVALIASGLAGCVLVWIANHEGNINQVKELWTNRKQRKSRMITIPFILAFVGYLTFMIIA